MRFLYFLMFQVFFGSISSQNIPDSEMEALYDLYSATNGQSWLWQNLTTGIPWNFEEPANPCTGHWQGVTCTLVPPFSYYHVSQLNLIGYNLDGTLPDSLDKLSYLTDLRMSSNSLVGSLPVSLGNITSLQYLYLDKNLLTSTIPSQLGNLSQLLYLYLDHNILSGTVPASLGALSAVQFLMVYRNRLSGTIPPSLGNLSELTNLYLDHNSLLTGTIPHSLSLLSKLQNFDVSANLLSGIIPHSLGFLPQLHSLYLHTNFFSGEIPEKLGNVSSLENLDLSHNLFSGSIPTSFSSCSALRQMLLQYNHLTGSLEGIVDPTVQSVLTTIQINHNALTGTLPAEIFELSQLNAFVAVSNCFIGTIPSFICNCNSLISLVLDGLSSARVCRNTLLDSRLSSSYSLSNAVSGKIPTCLWQMPLLATLHLSGNGITGALLLAEGNISLSLTDLALSHNLLTGSIPRIIQQRKWSNLDLSFNRLTGTLYSDFASSNAQQEPNSTSLSLENNRLSGVIPLSIGSMTNVSVLGSNVFSCDIDGRNLPQHDSGRINYQCSSMAFDVPYYIWLSLVGVLIMALLALWKQGDKLTKFVGLSGAVGYVRKFHAILTQGVGDIDAPKMKAFFHSLEVLCHLSFWSTVYILVVLLTIYPVLSYFYGTLTYSYAWSVSAAYSSGSVPVALEMPLYIALLCGTWALFTRTFVAPSALNRSKSRSSARLLDVPVKALGWSAENLTTACLYITYVTLNVLVVGGANVAYVYVVIYKSTTLVVISQILLSFFKLFWNNQCTAYLLKVLVGYFSRCYSVGRNAGTRHSEYSEFDYFSLRLFVALINNITVPCVVIAGISPSCFYNVFVDAPAVTSTYMVSECQSISASTGECASYKNTLMSTSYNPPFSYSYQCSSSLVTYYSPAFVFLCMTSAFLTPAAQYVLQQLHKRARPGSRWSKLTFFLLPRILKPLGPVGKTCSPLSEQKDTDVQTTEEESEEDIIHSFDRCLNPTRVLVTLMTYLGMILTFGAVFPPLAVALTVTVVVIVCFLKINAAEFLISAKGQSQQAQAKYVSIIEKECRGVGSVAVLQTALWMLISFSCCFYALFLFDTLGDTQGFRGAYWVLIVVPLSPLCIYAAFVAFRHWKVPLVDMRSESAVEDTAPAPLDLEMKDFGDMAPSPTFSPLSPSFNGDQHSAK